MNYAIKIKSKQGETESYYYQHPSTTNGGEPVYFGNIEDRAFWYDDSGGQWFNTDSSLIGDATAGNDKYQSPTLYGVYADASLNEIESKQYTLGDAWYRAETIVFESLRDYSGCTEERECYRGYLPVFGETQVPSKSNVWMLESGGSTNFDTDRLATDNALWCSIQTDATIESLWSTREKAMKFVGMVECWLKETNNMEETGNVTWCRMLDIPDSPAREIYGGDRDLKFFWRVIIPLEIVYATEYTYI